MIEKLYKSLELEIFSFFYAINCSLRVSVIGNDYRSFDVAARGDLDAGAHNSFVLLLFQTYGGGAFGPTASGPGSGPGGGVGVEGATYPPDSPYFPFGTRGVPPPPSVTTPTPASNPATPTGNSARLPNPSAGETLLSRCD